MKKLLSLVLCFVLSVACLSVLTACGSKEKTIMLWGPEEHRDLYLKWAEEFRSTHEDAFKGYKFEFAGSGDAGASAEMGKDPLQGAALYSFANDQLADLSNLGALSPLAEADVQWVKENNLEDAVESTKIGGQYSAYPFQADNGYYMYYNRDAFKGTSAWDNATDKLREDVTFRDLYAALDKRGEGDAVYKDKNGNDIKLNWSNGMICMPMASAWYVSGIFFSVGGDYEVRYNAEGKQESATCTFTYVQPEGTQYLKDADFSIGLNALECLKNIFLNTDGSVNKHYLFADESYNDKYSLYINTANEDAVKTPLAAMLCGTWKDAEVRKAWGDNYDATVLPMLEGTDGKYAYKNFRGYKHMGVNPLCEFVRDKAENIVVLHEMAKYFTNKEAQLERYKKNGSGPSNKEAVNDPTIKADKALVALQKQYDRVCVYPETTTMKDKDGNSLAGKPVGTPSHEGYGKGFRVQDSVPQNYWTPLTDFGQNVWNEYSEKKFNAFHESNIKTTLAELQRQIEKSA